MGTLLKLGAFALVAIAIALYARVYVAPLPPQPAAVALTPERVPVAIEGTIVYERAPSKNSVPYLLYTEETGRGVTAVKTKRLVFSDVYVCMAGDIPCAAPMGESHSFPPGSRAFVAGVAEADVIYVTRIDLQSEPRVLHSSS